MLQPYSLPEGITDGFGQLEMGLARIREMGLASPSQNHFGSCDSNFLNSHSSKLALHALERSSCLLSNATSARFKFLVVAEI